MVRMTVPTRLRSALATATLLVMLLATVPASAQSTTASLDPTPTSPSNVTFILPSAAPTSTAAPVPAPPPPTAGNGTAPSCPALLIAQPPGLESPNCVKGCCIRCPAVESFYEPGQMAQTLNTAYYVRQVSLASAIFMAISYLVLPGKRAQPHISVLFLTVSVALWFGAFDLMNGKTNACFNEIEESTAANSSLCGAQGVLIIYLTQTSALWCSLLIYKLHLLAVWRLDFIDRHYGWFTAFCWIFPLAFAIPVAVKGLAAFPGIGFSCLTKNEHLHTYLFYPIAVYMYPAMLCHVVTVGKMIHLAIMSSKIDTGLSQLSTNARMQITTTMQAKRLLRGQWRPALMLATNMSCLTVFWLFYFIDAKKLSHLSPDTKWLEQWYTCVVTSHMKKMGRDDTQRECSRLIARNLPSFSWFTAAELLLAILGIVVAVVFVTKAEFWEEWSFLLSNVIRRGKMGNGSRGRRSPGNTSASPTMVNNPRLSGGQDMRKVGSIGQQLRLGSSVGTTTMDAKSMSTKELNGAAGTQWYDMDDLLDKEYEEQGNNRANLQRSLSQGSRITFKADTFPNSDPPQYTGDILYRPPVQEANVWVPSAHTLSSPTLAYLTPSNNERYVEQPVVPLPVPRASMKAKSSSHPNLNHQHTNSQQIFLSSPPQSPKFAQATTSLSPMPPKSAPHMSSGSIQVPVSSLPRQLGTDSGPIPRHGAVARGSPAMSHRTVAHTATSPKVQAALYNSNESGEKIMVASRESMGTSKGISKITSNPIQINTQLAQNVSMDQRTRSPPPIVPMKSPARQHPGYMSPPLHVPTSPTYRE